MSPSITSFSYLFNLHVFLIKISALNISYLKRSVSGTSGGRLITNTRGPLSDVIEAAATIRHNLRFKKPWSATQIFELVAWHASCLWFSGSNPDRADNFFQTRRKR